MTHFSPGFITNPATGYTIENSVWFEPGSDTLVKTFSGAGTSDKKAVISWWEKKLGTGDTYATFHTPAMYFLYETSNEYRLRWNGTITTAFQTNAVYRDYGAWTHHVLDVDTTQGTDTNSLRKFTNGVLDTLKSTSYPAQYATWDWNQAVQHNIPQTGGGPGLYLAEFINLDGQSIIGGDLAITDLVDTDSNGVPMPVDPSGLDFTGNNSFWLDFAEAPGTGNGAGTDVSGNNNHFAETSIDPAQQVTDSPTDDAGNDVGNYATFNPLGNEQGGLYGGVANLSEGNTRRSAADGNWYNAYSTIAMNTTQGGKWYAEFEYITSSATTLYAGVALKNEEVSAAWQLGSSKAKSWAVNATDGKSYYNGTGTTGTGGVLSTGDIIMVAYDADNETLYLGVNDSWFGSAEPDTSTSPTYSNVPTVSGDNVFFAAGVNGTTVDCKANFGNEAFAYTIPTGYKALSTANLPAPTVTKPSNYFQAESTPHNGTSAVVVCNWDMDATNTLIISKNSDASEKWFVSNGAAGETKHMDFALTTASTTDSNAHSVIGANLTMGSAFAANDYMTYFIKAGATSGVGVNSGVIHENGGSTNVAHGLGVTPEAGWAKRTNSTGGWYAFTPGMTSQTDRHLFLDTTVAEQTVANVWGTHSPTNTVLGAGASGLADGTYDVVSFTSIAGFSKFTSYTGNGVVDGPYVELGFRAKFFMIKGLTVSGSWTTHDTVRNAYNPSNSVFYFDAPNQSGSDGDIDVTANGLKIRGGPGNTNTSAEVYVVWAFAENPFGGSGVAQARAR